MTPQVGQRITVFAFYPHKGALAGEEILAAYSSATRGPLKYLPSKAMTFTITDLYQITEGGWWKIHVDRDKPKGNWVIAPLEILQLH